VACLDLPYFLYYFKNSMIFRKVIFIQVLSETFLIERRTEQDIIINIDKYSHTTSVNFIRFKQT